MGEYVPAYNEEAQVDPNSQTETYVAMKLMIDNWRWEGVPVYVRTGKRLAKRASEVAIQLKEVPAVLFGEAFNNRIQPNVIAINIQPDDGIGIGFESKVPGLEMRMERVRMDFRYLSGFGPARPRLTNGCAGRYAGRCKPLLPGRCRGSDLGVVRSRPEGLASG